MKQIVYRALALMFIISITGCSTVTSWMHPSNPPQRPMMTNNLTPEQYLQLAATAPSPQQQYYQLYAVTSLIQQNKLTRAGQVLATVNTYGAPKEVTTKKQLLYAKVQLADQKPDLALQALHEVPITPDMSQKDQTELHDNLAQAYEKTGNIVASIEQRNLLNPLLPSSNIQKQNQLSIWDSVQHLPDEELKDLLSQPLSSDIRGWLELAQMAQKPTEESSSLVGDLYQWRKNYPEHSGNQILPNHLERQNPMLTQNPKHIVLLLPLSGKFGKNGNAIRNGFMAAYYNSKRPKNEQPAINFLDTNKGDIVDLYKQAIHSGADFVIGPLTKSKMSELTSRAQLTVPTLMLSYIPELSAPNLYQFGLSQFDEAEQIAEQGLAHGYSKAIIISPDTSWAQPIVDRFKSIWLNNGGEIVDSLAYNKTDDLSLPIKKLMQVNQSDDRAKRIEKLIHQKVRHTPNRRQDVDMIFLVGLPRQARAIRPMLKFYYAGDIPVFATSLINQASNDAQNSHDLDDVQFTEMPWVVGDLNNHLQAIQLQSKKLWNKSYQHNPKFYALGVDAHELTLNLKQLAIFPHFSVHGATGTLYLRNNGHVYRKLKWAVMSNGHPRLTKIS